MIAVTCSRRVRHPDAEKLLLFFGNNDNKLYHNHSLRGFMVARRVLSFALCLLFFTVAGAAAQLKPETAAKPSPRASGQATIYFILSNSFGGAIWGRLAATPDIKVDGRNVGRLVTGTYLSVNRPPGHHTLGIDVSGIFGTASWESDVVLAAGQSYFFQIGPKPTGAIGQDLANALVQNTRGQFVPGHGFMASFSFYSLDIEHGRAEIANLKKIAP